MTRSVAMGGNDGSREGLRYDSRPPGGLKLPASSIGKPTSGRGERTADSDKFFQDLFKVLPPETQSEIERVTSRMEALDKGTRREITNEIVASAFGPEILRNPAAVIQALGAMIDRKTKPS
jgi:hypothetical protein